MIPNAAKELVLTADDVGCTIQYQCRPIGWEGIADGDTLMTPATEVVRASIPSGACDFCCFVSLVCGCLSMFSACVPVMFVVFSACFVGLWLFVDVCRCFQCLVCLSADADESK